MKKIISFILITVLTLTVLGQNKGTGLVNLTEKEKAELLRMQKEFKGAGASLLKSTLTSYGDASATKFDLREVNGVTAVRDQGVCGSCWAFSSNASLESNYALKNNAYVDFSEQSLLGCASAAGLEGDCILGGHPSIVFTWLLYNPDSFLEYEDDNPYMDNDITCTIPIVPANIHVVDAGIFLKYFANSRDDYISTVKELITGYGALSAAIQSNHPDFINHKGGNVITAKGDNLVDHAINVIGWDDSKNAWLIKNSWGTDWGDRGYAWVDYDALNLDQFMYVDTTGRDESNEATVEDIKDKVILNLADNLGANQEYQEIFVKIDDGAPFRFYMNKSGKLYHNYIPVSKGEHRIQVITKTLVKKKDKKVMIFGVLKGPLEIKGNVNYKLKYGKRIKDNIFNLEIERVKGKKK